MDSPRILNIMKDIVTCVRWSPDGESLATASADESVKVIDFGTGKITHTLGTAKKGAQSFFKN